MTHYKSGMENRKFDKAIYIKIGILIAAIGFHLLWYFIDGINMTKDSLGYIEMHISREAIYPLFLLIMRTIFGETIYLDIAIIAQSMLAGYAMWKFIMVVSENSSSKYLLPLATALIQVAVVFMTRFLAGRQSAYSNSITTEGLSIPLFLLFIIHLFLSCKNHKKNNMIVTVLLAMILVNIRKQLIIAFAIIGIMMTMYLILKKLQFKSYVKLLIILIICFGLSSVAHKCYNYGVRGEFVGKSKQYEAILNNALYGSDLEDADLFEGEIEQIAYDIISEVDKLKLNYTSNQDDSMLGKYYHYEQSYDAIGYGIVNTKVTEFVEDNYQLKGHDVDFKVDEINGQLAQVLVQDNYLEMIKIMIVNMVVGCMNTVGKTGSLFLVYSILIYLAYCTLFCLIYKRQKEADSLIFAFIVASSIAINVVAVGIMIFAQSRYMIYNMSLFYVAFIWLIYDFISLYLKKNDLNVTGKL